MEDDADEHKALPYRIPSDYYERLYAVEQHHWWHRGMRSLSNALLGARLTQTQTDQDLLDAGCGTGGFLRWLVDIGSYARVCGVDISSSAIELAKLRVPEAELYVAPLRALPFERGSFDLVFLNDVLQHLPEPEVDAGLGELKRVLRPAGALLVRTNGARCARSERVDWRVYDRPTLRATLEGAGFRCERVTYANMLGVLWSAIRSERLHAPTERSHGIPAPAGAIQNAVGSFLLGLEERYLSRPSRTLPLGQSLLALASPS